MKTHFHSAAAFAVATCLIASALAQASSSTSPRQSTSSDSKSVLDTTSGATTSTSSLKWADKRFVSKVAESGQLEIAMAQLAAQRTTNADIRAFAQQLVSDHEQLARKLDQLADRKGLRDDIAEFTPSTLRATSMTGRSGSDTNSSSAMNSSAANPAISSASNPRSMATSSHASNDLKRDTTPSSDTPAAGQVSPGSYATGEYSGGPITSTTSTWNDPTNDRHYRRLAKKDGAEFDKEFIAMMVDDHEDDIALFDRKSQKADDADVRAFAEESLPTLQRHLKEAQRIAATQKS